MHKFGEIRHDIKIILLAGILTTFGVSAGSTLSTINKILIYEAGMLIYVYPQGGVNNPPMCHGSNGDYYSFSATRPMAKEYLSGMLSAQARKATVVLWGTGACDDQTNSETLRYFCIEN